MFYKCVSVSVCVCVFVFYNVQRLVFVVFTSPPRVCVCVFRCKLTLTSNMSFIINTAHYHEPPALLHKTKI